jgi:glycosyltransferase 2 family protein
MSIVLVRVVRLMSRLIVAGGLTAYILWKSHPTSVLAAGTGADWRLIGIAVLLVLADRSLMAYRWVVLLCTVEPASRPPLAAVMRIFFVSTFVGTFLPASVGGDAVRAYSLARLGVRVEDAVASVFMDRILGVASVLALAAIGLTLARDLAGNGAIVFGLAGAGAMCVATVLLIFNRRSAALATHLVRLLPFRTLRHAARRVIESIQKYVAYPGPLTSVLICSMAVQGLRIVQAYYLGRGLGIDAPLDAYVAFVPIILLVMLLPVTFNGIGTSQAAFVWFFGRAGVAAPAAFALSVLFVALGIIGNLPGGVLFAFGRSQPGAERFRSSIGRIAG